jgi:hypothetical protein
MRYLAVVVVALCLSGAVSWKIRAASPSNPPATEHKHSQDVTVNEVSAGQIDGAKNPELVPDNTAYRLVLMSLTVPARALQADTDRQNSHLYRLLLPKPDHDALTVTIADFRDKYAALVDAYNQEATAALEKNEIADVKPFLAKREALINDTRNALSAGLSDTAMAKFHSYVMGQKSFMLIDAQEGK